MPWLRPALFTLAVVMIVLAMIQGPDALGNFDVHPWVLIDLLVALVALLVLVVQDHRKLRLERGPSPSALDLDGDANPQDPPGP